MGLGHAILTSLLSGVQNVGTNIDALWNPKAFEEDQQNRRLAAQLSQQLNLHNTMTPYEQAQLGLAQQQQHDTEGQQVWQMLQGGATPTGPDATPDFSFGGQGFSMPHTHIIHADSPVGKALGLTEDVRDLPTSEYLKYVLPASEKLSIAADKKSQLEANAHSLQMQLPGSVQLIASRFDPSYYQGLYGGWVDPLHVQHALNFTNRFNDALETDRKNGDQKATTAVLKELDAFKSPAEEARAAQMQRQVEISARQAQNADTRSDRAYQYEATNLGKLEAPIASQIDEIQKGLSYAQAGTAESDAVLIPQFLKAMAGGKGSGLKITGAELGSVKMSRGAGDALLALAQNFKNGQSLTPTQRSQMSSLMQARMGSLGTKFNKIQRAKSDLIDSSGDVQKMHRIGSAVDSEINSAEDNGSAPTPALQKLRSKYNY